MKFGVPWSVKGIRPEARETAKEAARRAGMSVEDWLNSVILQQATQDSRMGQPHAAADEASYRAEIAGVNQRLDALTHRLEQATRTGPAAYAPRRKREETQTVEQGTPAAQPVVEEPPAAPQIAPQMAPPLAPAMPAPPPQPKLPMPPALERALAEIAARQRALDGEPVRPLAPPVETREPALMREAPPTAPARPEPPMQDLSGLERQLRNITDQIETLRKPGVEEAINALREELGDIARALDDAMPKRALDAIERQIAGLSQRVAEGRQAGVDAGALANIEHGLMEVRDALHHLMPAERLIGFNEAVADLAEKIDLIVAQRDPATLRQLDDAITTLRNMAGNVASNEAVGRLAAEVQALSEKVEQIGRGPDADLLSSLEHRIDGLSQALAERVQAGDTASPRLEALLQSMSDKIERIGHGADSELLYSLEHRIDALSRALAERTRDGNTVPPHLEALVQSIADKVEQIGHGPFGEALNNLEHRIDALSQALAERVEAGSEVPPHLEALLQSISDKIEQIQHAPGGDNIAVSHLEDRIVALVERLDASDGRLGHLEAIERGLADLLVHIEEIRWAKQQPVESPDVDALKHDMARTQDALAAVHGTLGVMVERLEMIEQDIRSERPAPFAAAPAPPHIEEEPPEPARPTSNLARLLGEAPKPAPSERSHLLDALMPARAPEAHKAEPALPPAMPAEEVHLPEPAPPEHDAHLPAPVPAPPLPLRALEPPLAAPMPAPKPQPAPRPVSPPEPHAAHAPLNPDLPPDQPLEPGSGPPQFRAHHSTRLAALEAALGGARPAAPSAGGQTNFIAAARRAAKAALQEHEVKALRGAEPEEPAETESSLRDKIMKRAKSLLVAASIIALVVGSVQVAGNYLRGMGNATRTAQRVGAKSEKPIQAPKVAAAGPAADNSLLSPAKIDSKPAITGTTAARAPDMFDPPAMYPPGDVTGSIPQAARNQHPAPPPKVAPVKTAEELPSGIGSARLRKAALAGDSGAAYEVASRYAEGHGVPADAVEAAHWFERAADKGLVPAQFRFASMLEKGQGVAKDLARARKLYRAAADKGNAKAMHNLAVLYAEGVDGKPDYTGAVSWFRKAAQHGVADSQYNLGVLCARGIGTDKNLEESYKWFALAAAQGDKESAKKRDEIASHLDAGQLAAARHAVQSFKALPQPAVATAVPAPPGGWGKPDATAVKSQAKPPMSHGAFTVGNR